MIFTCLSTGSSGNAYILESQTAVLIIEAGKGMFSKIIANLHKEKKLIGCIISHKHSDHFGDAEKIAGISDILEFKNDRYEDDFFIIKRFLVYHNVECFGFAIYCKEEKKTFVFITDFTKILDRSVYGLKVDFLAIELSYNELIYCKMDEAEKFGLQSHSSDFHTVGVIRKFMFNNPQMKAVTLHKSERACNYGLTNKALFHNFGLRAEIVTEGKKYKF